MTMSLPADYLDQIKAVYPKRWGDQGWLHVRTLIPRALTAGATWEEILQGTKAYAAYCDARGITGSEHVKCARTFYDYRTQGWTEDYAPPPRPKTAADQRLEARWDSLKARATAIGFRPPTPVESADVYETTLRQVERERSYATPSANHDPSANILTLVSKVKVR